MNIETNLDFDGCIKFPIFQNNFTSVQKTTSNAESLKLRLHVPTI
jgi:hypothetical protein